MNNISDASLVKQLDKETVSKEFIFSNRLPNASTNSSHKSHQPSHISRNLNKTHNIDKNVPLPEIAPKKHKLAEGIKNAPTPAFKLGHEYVTLNDKPEIYIGDKIGYESKLYDKETSVNVNRPLKNGTLTKCRQTECNSKKVTFSDESADETSSSQLKLQSDCLELKDVSAAEEEIKSSDEETFKTADTHISFDKTPASQGWIRRNPWKTADPPAPTANDPYIFKNPSLRNERTSNPLEQSLDDSYLRKNLWSKVWPSNKSTQNSDVPNNKPRIMQQQITLNQPGQSSDYPNDTYSTNLRKSSPLNQVFDHSYVGQLRKGFWSKMWSKLWPANPSNKSTSDTDISSNKQRTVQQQITLDQSDQSSDYSSRASYKKRHSWPSHSSSEATSVIFRGRRKWSVEEGSNRNYIRALVHCDVGIRTDGIESRGPQPQWVVNYDNANYIKSFISPCPKRNALRIR